MKAPWFSWKGDQLTSTGVMGSIPWLELLFFGFLFIQKLSHRMDRFHPMVRGSRYRIHPMNFSNCIDVEDLVYVTRLRFDLNDPRRLHKVLRAHYRMHCPSFSIANNMPSPYHLSVGCLSENAALLAALRQCTSRTGQE